VVAAPKHQYQDLYAAMIMGKTLEEELPERAQELEW
jgi:hypothetical protein